MVKQTLLVLTLGVAALASADGPRDRHSVTRIRHGDDVRTWRTYETRDGKRARVYTDHDGGRWHRSTDGAVRLPGGRTAHFETERYRNPVNGNVRRTWSVEGPNGKTRSGGYRRR